MTLDPPSNLGPLQVCLLVIVYHSSCSPINPITDSETITDLLPTHYLTVHQSAIRALAWIQAPPCSPSGAPRVDGDPTAVASGGYDGMECMTDIREGQARFWHPFQAMLIVYDRCDKRIGVFAFRWWSHYHGSREHCESVLRVAEYAGQGAFVAGASRSSMGAFLI